MNGDLVWFMGLQKLSAKLQLVATIGPNDPNALELLRQVHGELEQGIQVVQEAVRAQGKLTVVP